MLPTEELFHRASDRYELTTLANDPKYSTQLAEMRRLYDSELSQMQLRVVAGHGYEPYPTLFDRTTPWDQKAMHLKSPSSISNGEDEAPKSKNKRKKL